MTDPASNRTTEEVRYPPIGGYIDENDPGSLLPPEKQRELRNALIDFVTGEESPDNNEGAPIDDENT